MRSLINIFPVSDKMKVITDTATGLRIPSGVITKAIELVLQASRSTLS